MKSDHVQNLCCHQSRGTLSQTLAHELMSHFPYALFAVATSLIAVSLFAINTVSHHALHGLFHSLHFLHILFAATGTVIAYRRHGGGLFGALLVGTIVPTIFCTLSDAVMPYVGGQLFGVHMHFHWCFRDHALTVLPFLVLGVFNGILMSMHDDAGQDRYMVTSHFAHIFISAFASTVYLISHGFSAWQDHLAYVFVFLLCAVLIPCTFADVVVPVWFGLFSAKRREKAASRKG